jgi:hypothetical protein
MIQAAAYELLMFFGTAPISLVVILFLGVALALVLGSCWSMPEQVRSLTATVLDQKKTRIDV